MSGKWIPVENELPKIGRDVLLSTNTGAVFVGHRCKPELIWQVTEGSRKRWVYDPDSYTDDIDALPRLTDIAFEDDKMWGDTCLAVTSANYNGRSKGVTAWMSLPDPYTEDKS
jgi:hypothetical protein